MEGAVFTGVVTNLASLRDALAAKGRDAGARTAWLHPARSVPEDGLIQRDNPPVFDEQRAPRCHRPVLFVVVPDNAKFRFHRAFRRRVMQFPRLHMRAERLLTVFEADGQIRPPLRLPKKSEVMAPAFPAVVLVDCSKIDPLPLEGDHRFVGLLESFG